MPDVVAHLDLAVIDTAEMRGKNEEKSLTDTIAAVQFKEMESEDDQMARHQKVGTIDSNELYTD